MILAVIGGCLVLVVVLSGMVAFNDGRPDKASLYQAGAMLVELSTLALGWAWLVGWLPASRVWEVVLVALCVAELVVLPWPVWFSVGRAVTRPTRGRSGRAARPGSQSGALR